MEKYYFAAKSFELHTCMICVEDVFVVSCYLLGLSAWFIFQMSFLMLIKVVNTNVVCLVVRSLAHVCIGGIICYFLFWLALIYVARAAAQQIPLRLSFHVANSDITLSHTIFLCTYALVLHLFCPCCSQVVKRSKVLISISWEVV